MDNEVLPGFVQNSEEKWEWMSSTAVLFLHVLDLKYLSEWISNDKIPSPVAGLSAILCLLE